MNTNESMYCLPLEAYTSEEWFHEEKKKIFDHTWQFAGFVEDLKKPGDHLCVNIGSSHLMILMDETGKIQALHTTCRHRGNRIESISGEQKKHLVCPYHKWSYNLNGHILGIPEANELEVHDKKDLSLNKGSIAIWKTLIFAHPDENAPSFHDYLAGLNHFMGPHKPELLEEYYENNQSYLVKCNWKIFAENFMDGYHLAYLHANTLNMYNHDQQEARFIGPHWTFYEPLTDEYTKNLSLYGYEPINHISKLDLGAYVHLLFPNLVITESESTWTILQMIPLKANLTLLTYRTKVMPKMAKKSKWYLNTSKKQAKPIEVSDYEDPLSSNDFMIEDMYVCENIQSNMENGSFSVGPLHESKEKSLNSFQKVIINYMEV